VLQPLSPQISEPTIRSTAIEFAGITFRGLLKSDLLTEDTALKVIIPVNAELIVLANQNERFRGIVNANLATFDGYWPFLFAVRRNPQCGIEKISGSDLIYDVCSRAAEKKLSVFVLGASESNNLRAVETLRKRYGLRIDGYSPPSMPYPFSATIDRDVIERIVSFGAQVVLVAFGAPKQEFWIDDHRLELEKRGVRLIMAVGGSIDMVSGLRPRAPRLVQRLGCESLWRVAQEPRLRLLRFLNCFRFLRYI
jgi:N-acetylglucosaminyldiphosphoundecaprenol N-acetyl-beta-D-mannosaminyltransferase